MIVKISNADFVGRVDGFHSTRKVHLITSCSYTYTKSQLKRFVKVPRDGFVKLQFIMADMLTTIVTIEESLPIRGHKCPKTFFHNKRAI